MTRRRRAPGGFTLLELLVVVTILGILSAVVVFAVRGSGDKGRAAAVGTEERTIRTALELYCARFGTYPGDVQALIDARFLSNTPGYTVLSTGDDPVAFPDGKCPRTPQHYALSLKLGNRTPGWEEVDRPPKGVGAGDYRNMVQLLDGRIFTGTSIFDPADGTKGSWKLASPNLQVLQNLQPYACSPERRCAGDTPTTMVVMAGAAATCQADETTWCGRVLSFVQNQGSGGEWELFDPTVPGSGCGAVGPTANCAPIRQDASGHPTDVGQWTAVKAYPAAPQSPGDPGYDWRCDGRDPATGISQPPDPQHCVESRELRKAVQLRGSGCAPNCGKVLLLNSPTMDHAQLWDPKAWAASSKSPGLPYDQLGFQDLGQYGTGGGWDSYSDGSLSPMLQTLPTGDVLVVAGSRTRFDRGDFDYYTRQPAVDVPTARLFTSSTKTFEVLANQPASRRHSGDSDETALLPDGRVMVTSNYTTGQAWNGTNNTLFPANVLLNPNPPADQQAGATINPRYPNPNPGPDPHGSAVLPPEVRKADVFDPATRSWATPIAPCGEDHTQPLLDQHFFPGAYSDWYEKYCHVLSSLPGGRVLAWTEGSGADASHRSAPYRGRTYVSDPTTTTWLRQADMSPKSGDMPDPIMPPKGGVLITGSACGTNCNKVLAVNDRTDFDYGYGDKKLVALLFTPPP